MELGEPTVKTSGGATEVPASETSSAREGGEDSYDPVVAFVDMEDVV